MPTPGPRPEDVPGRRPDRWIALAIFLFSAALYISSAGPGLPAYRDAGEMTLALGTLGVAHPPGYPTYVMAGSLAARLPLGCVAFRASAFSAVCGAAALALLFLLLVRVAGRAAAVVAVVALALANPFWELSAVPEMYALGALFIIAVLYASFVLKNPALAGLLFGLGLGVRMDTLLLAPVFAWPFLRKPRALLVATGFGALGALVFLYLPIRSAQQPWLDWADPETLDRFWGAVTRRSYGSGLDLLSQSYKRGENFIDGLRVFGRYALANLGPLALAALGGGLALGWRTNRGLWAAASVGLLLSGPIFIFMANMPVNPHAVAILEAAFLAPVIFGVVLAALGVAAVAPRWRPSVMALLAVATLGNSGHAASVAYRRHAWAGQDYSENVLRSAPENTVVVFREDVQIFSLWDQLFLFGRRPDLRVLGVGLSTAGWYWDMIGRWTGGNLPRVSLNDANSYLTLASANRPVGVGFETDAPADFYEKAVPRGLLRVATLSGLSAKEVDVLSAVAVYRVRNAYEARDFFSTDLLSDVARAAHLRGVFLIPTDPARADWYFRMAAVMDPDFPQAWSDRAYLALSVNDHQRARGLYEEAVRGYEDLLKQAVVYRSLPESVRPVKEGLSVALNHQGVCLEREGKIEEARALYRKSIAEAPSAPAFYNLGVTYWNHDWNEAANNFLLASRLDPSNVQARKFAIEAQARAQAGPGPK